MKKILKCDNCLVKNKKVITYRQNTSYTEDNRNFATLCPECKIENDEYWKDMWGELIYSRF
jgi:hypothetical protein